MTNKKLEENNEIFQQRQEMFKKFGYDIEAEKKFILDNSGAVSGNILEVGTGKGHFTLALARCGYNFTSIDVSEENQEIAKLNLEYAGLNKQVIFKIEDAESLNFQNAGFDVIFSVNTLHHLRNAYKVIAEMTRVISAQGKIILSDFNEQGFAIMDKIHASEGQHHDAGHVKLEDINNFLKRKGFLVKEYTSKNQDVIIAER